MVSFTHTPVKTFLTFSLLPLTPLYHLFSSEASHTPTRQLIIGSHLSQNKCKVLIPQFWLAPRPHVLPFCPSPQTLHKVLLDIVLFLDRTNRLLHQDRSTCSSSCIEFVSTDLFFLLSQNFLTCHLLRKSSSSHPI